jgi:hypothetical protein
MEENMIRKFCFAALACALCGCMVTNNDRAAAKAVKTYAALQEKKTPAKLTVAEVLTRCDSAMHNQLHRDLAKLHRAKKLADLFRDPLQMDNLRQALLDAEQARISLNYELGFLPEVQIVYDTTGAFDVPAELPAVTKFEKALLIADCSRDSALTRLATIRRLHADAVAAYDAEAHAANETERISRQYLRLLRCADLADAAGTTLADLHEITAAADRFDAFQKHQVTSH